MKMTMHAACRVQQRAISPLVIDLLFQFGKRESAGDGASKIYFDKAARRRVESHAGALAGFLRQHLNVYAVVSAEESVITAAHLTERIRHH